MRLYKNRFYVIIKLLELSVTLLCRSL